MALSTVQDHPHSRRKGKSSSLHGNQIFAWIWIAPAVIFVAIFLVYPTIQTVIWSLQNANSTEFVGLKNYALIFTSSNLLEVLKNNIFWLFLATAGTVLLGLIIAVLADRVRAESVLKATIFIPMALSFVAASVIWGFVYAYQPPGQPQIGLLNAIVTAFGGQPQGWLSNSPGNDVSLMVIYIWMWTGFCMVILSAALKGVPAEILEAARCDGASETRIFFGIIVPMISPTILVVTTTMVINVLKIFDVVYTLTGGNYHTDVVAMEFYNQLFNNGLGNFGLGSALAVLLLLAIIPVMIVNVRRFRAQEARR
ncbi:MAG TPA: sugar ABC transporter permease [Ktedonobacteraceae bacterium]|nr:sugar ABC transporter permease [Ktedonobacteraceae bacterium]